MLFFMWFLGVRLEEAKTGVKEMSFQERNGEGLQDDKERMR